MNQAGIQQKINLGYGKAAAYLGALSKQYRPTDPMNPLGNQVGTLMADFDQDPNFSHRAPSPYDKPILYGMFDATNVQRFDYLVAPMGTFFLAGVEPNKPPLCVQCNVTLTFYRQEPETPSASSYMGDQADMGITLMAGWPASLLPKYRGEKGPVNLPGDSRVPWFQAYVPSFQGIQINQADRAKDALGRIYTISAADLTDLGWEMIVQLSDT